MTTHSSMSGETHGIILRWLFPIVCAALCAVVLLVVAGVAAAAYMAIRSALNTWHDSLDELLFEAEELLDW